MPSGHGPNTGAFMIIKSRPAGQAVRRTTTVAITAGLIVVGAAGMASAKEAASGGAAGGGGTTAACNPVTSLTAKGDPRVGETGLASIAVSYGVKPCSNGQSVVVDAQVYRLADPSDVVYDNPNAPLNGKFTAFGIAIRTSYIVKITVTDAASGAVVGSLSTYSAAVPKGV